MKNKLEKLEAIRGFAALYVIFHHSFFSESFVVFGHNLSFIFKFGQEAVILFFLMSGFVIGYSFELSKDKSFWSYFQKRFYRIYIPLIIVMITHYAFRSYESGSLINPQWLQVAGNLFMLQDIAALKPNVIIGPYLGNAPLWSLSYEWWFYMSFFAFYVIITKVQKINLFVSVLVILSALSYIFYPNFVNRVFMYYGIWWTGIVMSRSFLTHSTVRLKDISAPLITLVVATLVLAVNCYLHKDLITTIGVSPFLELRHFGFTVVAVAAALIWQQYKWLGFDKLLGIFSIIAPFSYVLYISHYFLVAKADYLSFIENKYLAFLVYLIITIAYSYLIEIVIFPRLRGLFLRKKNNPIIAPVN